MSTPTSPRTTIPVITTELVQSSPKYSIDKVDGPPLQYRIEERRRTIYVTTSEPSLQLSSQTLDELFKLADIPDADNDKLSATFPRRTRSFEERGIHRNSHSYGNLHRQDDASRPRRYLHKKNASVATPYFAKNDLPASPASSSHSGIRQSWMMVPPARILFYHKYDPHYGFTNFSPHPVMYKGKCYPTSEHLFQSFKFQDHRPNLAEHIRTCSDLPSMAFSEARRFQPEVRKDWMVVNIEKMDVALWHKFTQHQDLKEELLSTGSAELVEDSDKDSFWGVGADGKGRNELGKALERLRAKLRNT